MPEQSDFLKSLNIGDSPSTSDSAPSISGGGGASVPVSDFMQSLGLGGPGSTPDIGQSHTPSPENGQTTSEAPKFDYQDPSKSWYSRAWSWLNTPLTESLFGLPEDRPGAGGFERGLEHIVSGLTSPLSLALTAATFGTGGFIESAGSTALKEALTAEGTRMFTDAEIAGIAKASQTALDAYKAQKPLEPVLREALAAGGHDPALLLKANKVFGDINKMSEFAEPEVQRNLAMVGLKGEGQRAAFLENRLSGVLPENATEEQIAEHAAAEAKARETIATANGGFSNAELQELARTGETLSAAKTGFHPIEDAVREAGIDPALWKKGQDVLYKSGLTEHDLLQGNMVERGAFQILRKTVPELPIAATVRASKTANSLLTLGFTLQQLESAAAMSPRFLDALKEGDYDKAWEYGTEATISGGLGVLGASHAFHSAGELSKPLLETKKFRPNDEWLFAQKALNEVQTLHAIGEQRAIDLDRAFRDILGHTQPGVLQQIFGESPEAKAQKNLDLASVFHQVVTGGDRVKAAQWYNALSEALGRDERLPIPAGEPLVPASIPRGETHVIPDGSNEAGEVRVGPDGRPVVWLSPNGWSEFASSTGTVGSGISYSFPEAEQAAAKLHPDSPVKELFDKAREASHLAAVARQPGLDPNFTVRVASEELQHTWQRELSQSGDIRTHLDQPQWNRLNGIIPAEQTSYLNNLEYDKDPVTRVAETAAKFRAGLIPEGVSDEDAARWLNEYYKEVEAKHGPQSLDEANRINDIARQHVEDIYAAREAASRSTDQEAGNRVLGGVQEGSGRPAGVGQEESPKGLSARELTPDESKEFDKLSKLKLRVGMGDPGSAGLVTGDNEVFIGRDHAELIREAGYKASPKEDLYAKFFKDGGVRIRTAGGTAHIDFMEPNADTWQRVYRSIDSIPNAGKYYVEFRKAGGGPGNFHINAYDKDNLVYKLQDLEEGRTQQAPAGTSSYWRQGLAARERENNAPTWYLKSNQLIDSRMSGPMPADTVLKMLENNGVKPDELKYTGISDFLKEKGKAPVHPDELRAYLAANNLQIQETTRGGGPTGELPEGFTIEASDDPQFTHVLRKNGKFMVYGNDPTELVKEAHIYNNTPTKFGTYQLPGGQNYREMLLTLPTQERGPVHFYSDGEVNGQPRYGTETSKGLAYVYFDPPTQSWASYSDKGTTLKTGFKSADEAKAELSSRQQRPVPYDERFQSSHWDEPNVVGHVRFNDRVGPNGEKLLHLEELQSDWHQKGRKQGYRETGPTGQSAWEYLKARGIDTSGWSLETAATEAGELGWGKGVPDAPFKKTWPELLMKRMIRYASENGYDGISWTPGEEQAARYDLSKQIDAVHYTDIGNGKYHVDAIKDGSIVASRAGTPQELEDFIGKDVTKKIVSGEGDHLKNTPNYRKLSGVDLKVGGEGMKGFYDKIVPEVANKLGKQFGAKVGETTLPDNKWKVQTGRPVNGQPDYFVRGASDAVPAKDMHFYDKDAADSFAEKLNKELGAKKVPYFPITDSMRESVLKQGQPLFSRERPKNGLPDNLDEMIRSNVFKNQPKEYQDLVMNSLRRVRRGSLSEKELGRFEIRER